MSETAKVGSLSLPIKAESLPVFISFQTQTLQNLRQALALRYSQRGQQ